ncbi:MAG TPA: ribonuclease H-like domain-containing protein [bacterium]|nr:ribonuclease H-like domain-containing protein [bacterium]
MADLYEKIRRFQRSSSMVSPIQPSVESTRSTISPSTNLASLASLPGVSFARDLETKIRKRAEERDRFLSTLGGYVQETTQGSFWMRRTVFPERDLPFSCADMDRQTVAHLGRDAGLQEFDPSRALFLDVETTGLAGGTGTVAFLVGIGRFVKGDFAVTQYLMRDYDEEPFMLEGVRRELRSAEALVTFNGKCFDVPLLSTRFRMNRVPQGMDALMHFDLLPPARRLWRAFCQQCNLTNLEWMLLGRHRTVDVPGSEIPQIYFDFVRGLRLERMRPVLEHNVEDIRSLAMLSAKACRLYRDPENEVSHPQEWFGLGRSHFCEGNHERALMYLKRSLESDLPDDLRCVALRDTSILLKKGGAFDEAVLIWEAMLVSGDVFRLFPYEELAKYHEHIAREPGKALVLVERALDHLNASSDNPFDRGRILSRERDIRQRLEVRLKRLRRKADIEERGI